MRVIACNAPYSDGGMGQLFASVVEQARSTGTLAGYYTVKPKTSDAAGVTISLERYRWLFRTTPLRASHAWREYVAAELFDRAVAERLMRGDEVTAFTGRALRTFKRARALGYSKLVLESATSHVAHVRRQHEQAARSRRIESSWLNDAQYRKTLREYEMADEIVVLSDYARETFLREGVPAAKIRRRIQHVLPRFAPPLARSSNRAFTVVFVGRLQQSKGIIDLLDAFSAVRDSDAALLLVGGTATAAMDRYLDRRIASDRRIRRCPGDPLPVLHRADVLVHPSYEDALALAPLEALACGVPVIVSEDTGMKEFVIPGETGHVVPTGDVPAIVESLRQVRARPLVGALPDVCRP